MNSLPDTNKLNRLLTSRFGIALRTESGDSKDGIEVLLKPEDLDAHEGFLIRTTIGWRSIRARLEIGRFGARLLNDMAHSTEAQRLMFASMAQSLSDAGGKIHLQINKDDADPFSPGDWEQSWTDLEFGVERTPVSIDKENEIDVTNAVLYWGGGILGMVIALMRVEEIELESDNNLEGLPEGVAKKVVVNRYERSRINRALCISIQGTKCRVCDLALEDRYGEIGRDFIHIHHVVPVSQLGPNYKVDPISDLVPVCPNCHAMLHMREPPYTIEDVRQRLLDPEGESDSH